MARRRFVGFLEEEVGTATSEYGVYLAVFLACLLAVAGLIGQAVLSSYEGISQALPGNGRKVAPAAVSAAATPTDQQMRSLPTMPVAVTAVGLIGLAAWLMKRARKPIQPLATAAVAGDSSIIEEPKEGLLFAKRQGIMRQLGGVCGLGEHTMLIRHIFTTRSMTISPTTTVSEAERQMVEYCCRHALVCFDGQLVGILSDRDVRGRRGCRVDTVMTRNPITVTPLTPVFQAVTLMIQKHISCLPVVDNGQLLGIVTTTDVMMALQCAIRLMEQPSAMLAAGLPEELELTQHC